MIKQATIGAFLTLDGKLEAKVQAQLAEVIKGMGTGSIEITVKKLK